MKARHLFFDTPLDFWRPPPKEQTKVSVQMNLPNYNSHKGIIEVQKRIALKHMFQEEPEWELSEKKLILEFLMTLSAAIWVETKYLS